MTPPDVISLRDVFAARRRLRAHLSPSPLRHSDWLSSVTNATVLLKLESVQPTNSFKIRGALNAALRLAGTSPSSTMVTASAGNHGRALALAARRLGMRAVVFTPAAAPETKRAAIERLGADLRDEAPDYDAAERLAREHAVSTDATFISPYNHPDVIAGAGTIALEILDALPTIDVIVVPLGGGGLASGVALAVKSTRAPVRVIGVEVDASRPFATSLARGVIAKIHVQPSLADGLVGNLEPGSETFDLVRRYVDQVVSVSEEGLRGAIGGLASEEHLIVEGAGATATAAVLAGHGVSPGQRAVVLVTGANIDLSTFCQVVDRR
jgi:threonine dehydratase